VLITLQLRQIFVSQSHSNWLGPSPLTTSRGSFTLCFLITYLKHIWPASGSGCGARWKATVYGGWQWGCCVISFVSEYVFRTLFAALKSLLKSKSWKIFNSLLHCLDWVSLSLSPLRSWWSPWLSSNFPYMAYLATLVRHGGPERALGGLVVLLPTSVTIISNLTLNFAHTFLQLQFCCTSHTSL